MHPTVDLQQLAVSRAPVAASRVSVAAKRRWLTRVVLPLTLLAGFVALLSYAGREVLSPPRAVTIVPVILSQGTLDVPVDTPLFRAAGWVEPRPMPSLVTAQAEGVVEKLLVIEGQEVKRGDVVAQLVTVDAELALEAADAEVALRESELTAAKATQVGASERLAHPVHLRAELADAEAALSRLESEMAFLPNQMKAARARSDFLKRDYESARRSGSGVPETTLAKTRTEMDAATAAIDEIATRQKRLPIEIAALKQKREAVAEKHERKIEETRAATEASAGVRVAEARLKQSKVLQGAAKLRLDRMVIRTPADGRVLALIARPGTRLTGMTQSSLQDASTVLSLYDPTSLQARVDVRLDDVGKVVLGQKVKIQTAALSNVSLDGQVLLATSQADIQKNTLSVKVAIRNPPSTLRPEMLCQVTFLASPRQPTPEDIKAVRMLIPRQLLDAEGVWVVDQLAGKAVRRSVELGASLGELVEVLSGLSASDKLIAGGRAGLQDGTRVRVIGEDDSLGIAPMGRKK